MGERITVRRDRDVVQVDLARPEARNAVDLALCHELRETFAEIDRDPTVRVVLLGGQGVVFCAGADLKERAGRDAAWVRSRRLASFAAYAAIEDCSAPVVAFVQGAVVGAGGEIAAACDFVVAHHDTTFRYPEPHWGTVGATQRLQRIVGKRRAKELLFTNRRIDADEAFSLGIVQRLTDDLEAERATVATSIGGAPPLAMRLVKQAIDLGAETDLRRGIDIEMAAIERCLADEGWQDGVRRFTDGERSATTDPEVSG